jgi:hypothetical protein
MVYKDKRVMLAVVCLLVLSGCFLGSWRKTTMTSYEAIGETLISTKTILKAQCDSGEIPAEKCEEIRAVYNNAVSLYKEAGDVAVLAIDLDDKIQKKKYMDMKNEVLALLSVIDKLIKGVM